MDVIKLHDLCKNDTRKAFDEFKHNLNIGLFKINEDYKETCLKNVLEGGFKKTVKYFIENNKLTREQITYLTNIIKGYENILIKTSNNYYKKNY